MELASYRASFFPQLGCQGWIGSTPCCPGVLSALSDLLATKSCGLLRPLSPASFLSGYCLCPCFKSTPCLGCWTCFCLALLKGDPTLLQLHHHHSSPLLPFTQMWTICFDGALVQTSCTPTGKHLGCGGGGWVFPVCQFSTMTLTQGSPVSCQDQLWSQCLLPSCRMWSAKACRAIPVLPGGGGQRSSTVAEWLQGLQHATVMSFGLLCPCRELLAQTKETPWHLLLSNPAPTGIKRNFSQKVTSG